MLVESCGPERAEEIHRLTQLAFREHASLDPPSGAVRETADCVRHGLSAGGGAIALLAGCPVGCLRSRLADGYLLHVRRVAVVPEVRRRGIGRALMAWAEEEAHGRGCRGVSVGVRVALPGNLAFYRDLGYRVTGEHRHDGYEQTTWLAMRKPLPAAAG